MAQVFLEAYQTSQSSDQVCLEVGGGGTIIFSSKWLLNKLIIYLQEHMSYKCILHRFGTVLFRKGGDLLTSLSWALGRMSVNNIDYLLVEPQDKAVETTHKKRVFEEAGIIVNDLLHADIYGLSSENLTTDPNEFNISHFMSMTELF